MAFPVDNSLSRCFEVGLRVHYFQQSLLSIFYPVAVFILSTEPAPKLHLPDTLPYFSAVFLAFQQFLLKIKPEHALRRLFSFSCEKLTIRSVPAESRAGIMRDEFYSLVTVGVVACRKHDRPRRFQVLHRISHSRSRGRPAAEVYFYSLIHKRCRCLSGKFFCKKAIIITDYNPARCTPFLLQETRHSSGNPENVAYREFVGDNCTPPIGAKFNLLQ